MKYNSSRFSKGVMALAKGDWDIGIALDMIAYANPVNTIVLASGDGDYTVVVDKIIHEHNVSVDVTVYRTCQPPH